VGVGRSHIEVLADGLPRRRVVCWFVAPLRCDAGKGENRVESPVEKDVWLPHYIPPDPGKGEGDLGTLD